MIRRILRVIFSRALAFAFLAVLQICLVAAMLYYFAQLGAITYTIMTIISVLLIVAVLERDTLNPSYKVMWTFVIVLMPVFGVLFFLLWGHRDVPHRLGKNIINEEEKSKSIMVKNEKLTGVLQTQDAMMHRTSNYLWNTCNAPLYMPIDMKYFKMGEDFFPVFLQELKNAKEFIFMEYFIIEQGHFLESVINILIQKAEEGVDVRLLYDGVGCLATMPANYFKRINAQTKVKARAFCPVEFTVHLSEYGMVNHRDHRKITVIDGKIAFSGGLNIADEYININSPYGVWKDTTFMVKGRVANSFTMTFLYMWNAMSKDKKEIFSKQHYLQYFKDIPEDLSGTEQEIFDRGIVQPYYDTPLDTETVTSHVYGGILNHAKRYVYITTPYLIIDHEMISCLCVAAKSGIDVRIITPAIPDKPTVFLLTQSYYDTLLEAGVRIFEYSPGFMHAKMYVSDDDVAVVGSANMDYRSLYLHFENSSAFYGGDIPRQVRDDVLDVLKVSREVTLDEVKKTKWYKRIGQLIIRFFAPLM